MSTRLIQHLKNKCEADANVAILYAQWEFDQKLVGKALENIGGFYPHFSNHNASHSQQILVNIERILGDDVDLLSATDTWLILEAAYWHDVGMLVDAKNAKEVHTNPDFNFMIQTIANEKGHDLQKFCQAYVENNWLSAIGTLDHPFDGVEKYHQLIAEWFRRGHDKRVGKLVEDPFKDLGITSPRTELLPNRIYRYLGQICVSHGMNFSTLMETIPYKQTGLGTENCHPRFIGCLLRLGDLFDLDDNRFCPVMAKHVSNMPSISKHHHDKHLSLREFQLDKRTVKLVAECPDEMSYVETQNWFGWIREEFQNQMSQWNLIVPDLKFGSLPTIEQLDVKMEVKFENGVKKEKLLLNNKPMKFKLDEKNAMELLQGANLYSDEYSIYRELIQNSIDATMLRIWLEEDQEKLKELHPYHEDFLKILEKYPLRLEINKVKNIEGTLDSIWEFQIIDQGIGMSMVDLGYMQTMAGSNRNTHKKKIISEMPQWMRPSGEFGIGLHSAFLLTKDLPVDMQSIRFDTYSYFSHDSLDIEMSSPLGGKQGYCFITKNIGDTRKIGTATKFYIKVNFDLEKIEGDQNFNFINIDAFEKKWGTYEKEKIYEKILKNAPICTLGFSKKLISDVIWDKEKQVAFYIKNSIDDADNIKSFFFKGQKVEINNYREYGLSHCNYIDYMVDIYGVNAKKVLNISRDYWDSDFENRHSEYLKDLFEKHIAKIQKFETDLLKLTYCIDNKIDFKLSEHWLNGNVNGRKISDILNEVGFYVIDIDSHSPQKEDRKAYLRSNFNNYIILESESDNDNFIIYALKNYCQKYGYNRYILRLDEKFHRYPEEVGLTFYSKNIQPIDLCKEYKWDKSEFYYYGETESENVFEELWDNLIKECQFDGYPFHSRYLNLIDDKMNLLEEYKKLSFRFREYWDDLLIFSPYQVIENEIKTLKIDDLSMYVANRKNDLSNVQEYKNLYEKLIIEIDKYKKTPQ
ncbi:histidine kinase [Acinetobacter variabilis]|uniref:HD domain-containing protein n=1 Tax=Acinetobacter variabilis TaxID=70346 RepID=UPI000F691BC8|nr:histidine kinase [Acinetobacter variabilis]QXR19191.1 histidine kinase [Acinetobacter variabilis]